MRRARAVTSPRASPRLTVRALCCAVATSDADSSVQLIDFGTAVVLEDEHAKVRTRRIASRLEQLSFTLVRSPTSPPTPPLTGARGRPNRHVVVLGARDAAATAVQPRSRHVRVYPHTPHPSPPLAVHLQPHLQLHPQPPTPNSTAVRWALGIFMYILLVGFHPFDPDGEASEQQVLANMKTGKIEYDAPGAPPSPQRATQTRAHTHSTHTQNRRACAPMTSKKNSSFQLLRRCKRCGQLRPRRRQPARTRKPRSTLAMTLAPAMRPHPEPCHIWPSAAAVRTHTHPHRPLPCRAVPYPPPPPTPITHTAYLPPPQSRVGGRVRERHLTRQVAPRGGSNQALHRIRAPHPPLGPRP